MIGRFLVCWLWDIKCVLIVVGYQMRQRLQSLVEMCTEFGAWFSLNPNLQVLWAYIYKFITIMSMHFMFFKEIELLLRIYVVQIFQGIEFILRVLNHLVYYVQLFEWIKSVSNGHLESQFLFKLEIKETYFKFSKIRFMMSLY